MVSKPLHLTVVGFADGHAILKTGDVTFRVPRAQLPDNAKIGDALGADFYFATDQKKRQENLAKAILEEILGQK